LQDSRAASDFRREKRERPLYRFSTLHTAYQAVTDRQIPVIVLERQ